ncbi:hypothetical protein J4N42_16370 [Vibrio sp. SCSIO 43135]|uniref:hypothetical protein n=1 Tax=Vibrio sp. SCSIO 43135 TaxID=2819096 RepID=UPI0020753966|nr:hypothetical protein [Vibrio sp. SCSIO 43135]USD43742.1 hypothetical protein J4N42_16370 [Vibrio sp. SCSIO 43135]
MTAPTSSEQTDMVGTLAKYCEQLGLPTVGRLAERDQEWQQWCVEHDALFQHVLKAKPESSTNHHLLGLLTKSHIEITAKLSQHADSVVAMREAIAQSVGEEHSNKFGLPDCIQLDVITHAWLYVQGCMNMDYSLANDHAQNTAELLNRLYFTPATDVQATRVAYMESFYAGKDVFGEPSKPSFWQKLSYWINGQD